MSNEHEKYEGCVEPMLYDVFHAEWLLFKYKDYGKEDAWGGIDPEILPIVEKINEEDAVKTAFCCASHPEQSEIGFDQFYILSVSKNNKGLEFLENLYLAVVYRLPESIASRFFFERTDPLKRGAGPYPAWILEVADLTVEEKPVMLDAFKKALEIN